MNVTTPGTESPRREDFFHRLYTGTGAFDIVGKRTRWYVVLGLIVLVCLGSIGFKGFNFGIDFVGGTKIQMPAVRASGPIENRAVETPTGRRWGLPDAVQIVGSGDSQSIRSAPVADLPRGRAGQAAVRPTSAIERKGTEHRDDQRQRGQRHLG